jgi:magnesium-transporting ATPase (P-type)
MNLTACGVSLIGQFIGIESPITIIQMLWVNIIMDTLGGLAFAGEPPLDYYMLEKPKKRDEPILDKGMIKNVLIRGVATLLLCTLFLSVPFVKNFFGYYKSDAGFLTAFYALFIFSGLVNSFLARSERFNVFSNISKNKPFVFILILISVIQIFMIYFGGSLFRCVPLLPRELSFVILLSMTVIPFEMTRRLLYKLK